MSSVREATISTLEGKRLTRVLGRPTIKSVKLTRKEIGAEYAKAKTTHKAFPLGTRFGFAAAVLRTELYIAAHNKANPDDELDPEWEFEHPSRLASYDATAVGNVTDATRRKKEAERNEINREWERFDAYETVFKEKIEEAYDAQYLEALRDEILEMSHLTVSEVLAHLSLQCLALTNVEKEAKLAETRLPWDLHDDIKTFFTKLDKLEIELNELDIEWPTSMKITQAVKQMYESNQFENRDMRDWERKPAEDKTWVHCQSYFTTLFNDNKRFGDAAGNKHGFESAANIKEQKQEAAATPKDSFTDELCDGLREVAIAATADKEHIQQMTSTNEDLLQIVKTQQGQITQLIKQNGELTAALAKKGGEQKKERGTFEGGANEADPAKKKGYGCAICGKHRKTSECLELDKNKAKRKEGWKSIFA